MTIQLHISKALSADLHSQLIEASADYGAMQWYGHRVTVLRRKCVIVMEARSRYAMVFTGLTKPDFENFPALLRERLWREALSICQLDDAQSTRLAGLVNILSQPVQIMTGSDRSVQAHIKEVAWHLEWMAKEVGALPKDSGEEFAFGLRMNQMPRKSKGEKEYFYPLEVLREFWLGLLEHGQPRPLPDNVVPFRRPS